MDEFNRHLLLVYPLASIAGALLFFTCVAGLACSFLFPDRFPGRILRKRLGPVVLGLIVGTALMFFSQMDPHILRPPRW